METESARRVWVIAAAQTTEASFDGAFSRAITSVLRKLSDGLLDIDPVLPDAPLPTIARAIRREINSARDDTWLVSSRVDITDDTPSPPFFPNPAFASDRGQGTLRSSLDRDVLPFFENIDQGFDPHHFMERASGISAVAEHGRGMVGQFAGRTRELQELSLWLHGDDGNLAVVTGSPGVGKSALLGVLVCAAHPQLRTVTQELWRRAAAKPDPIDSLAVVHARQRDLTEISKSIARQFSVHASTPQDLISALRDFPESPVVIIDALDEIADNTAVMEKLLLPLTETTHGDGRPVARVLVATRPYVEFGSLLKAAERRGIVIDLDAVPEDVLADDLYHYVTGILRTTREYRSRGAVVDAFANELANSLTRFRHGGERWGEFLVAALYTRYFMTCHDVPVDSPQEASDFASAVPNDLIGVLELDLRSQPGLFWLRPILTALGATRGQGMPLSVLCRIVGIFVDSDLKGEAKLAPRSEEVDRTLAAARFYLRTVTDIDGTTLYRLFHHAIADHLLSNFIAQNQPDWRKRIFNCVFKPLGPPGSRDWSSAEPYLMRHAIPLATEAGSLSELLNDPEFLLRADQSSVRTALSDSRNDKLSLLPELVIDRLLDRELGVSERRLAACIEAVRQRGWTKLAERIAQPPNKPPLPWRPLWASVTTRPVRRLLEIPSADRLLLLSVQERGVVTIFNAKTGELYEVLDPPIEDFRLFELAERTAVLLREKGGRQWIWEPSSRKLVAAGQRFSGLFGKADFQHAHQAEDIFEDELILVSGRNDGALQVEAALTGSTRKLVPNVHSGQVAAVTTWHDADRLFVISGGIDKAVALWEVGAEKSRRLFTMPHAISALRITSTGILFVGTEHEILAFQNGAIPIVQQPLKRVNTLAAGPAHDAGFCKR